MTPLNTDLVPTVQMNSAKLDWFGTLRGRVGYAVNNVLVYGTGGLAYADVTSDLAFDCAECNPASYSSGSNSAFRTGWAAGADAVRTSGFTPGTTFSAGSKFAGNIVRAVLNYRFTPY